MTAAVTESLFWWDRLVPYCPPLGIFLADESISEIEVNPGGQIFIEVSGVTTPSGTAVPQHEIEAFITRVARWRGQDISDREPLLTVDSLKGLFNPTGDISKQNRRGRMYKCRTDLASVRCARPFHRAGVSPSGSTQKSAGRCRRL
jgi:hypothetical protein